MVFVFLLGFSACSTGCLQAERVDDRCVHEIRRGLGRVLFWKTAIGFGDVFEALENTPWIFVLVGWPRKTWKNL